MAAPSPALSSNSSDVTASTTTTTVTTATAGTTTSFANRMETPPPKTLRGLNKPKCRVCGNVARSRCPYESCKSCCSRNQNPCHIHVLKANATFPDKTPASSLPLFDQKLTKSAESSPSGTSLRIASLRQLSNNFAQFNNVQIPLRSKKPLTRKDAAAINEWRFSKLKEYRDRNIEVENEAFDRYMQNNGLLEEVFSMKSILEGPTEDKSSVLNNNTSPVEDNAEAMVLGMKLKLKSNPIRSDNFRKRIRQIVDQGLSKLQKHELNNVLHEDTDQSEINEGLKRVKGGHFERASTLSDLIDKLNKARNEEDLKSCLVIKSQIFSKLSVSGENYDTNDLESKEESSYSLPKRISTTETDQETLNVIDAHFSTLEQIEDL